ncbi:MAG: hypothetical protein ACOYYF_00640 [Chloroflexota bacterium]|nr:hypothetical protein [Chloroflexota bacterium]MBI5703496.1 hypothetical protein [Chloroflexota bacterium]
MQDDLIEEYYKLAQHVEYYPTQQLIKWMRPLGFMVLIAMFVYFGVKKPEDYFTSFFCALLPIGLVFSVFRYVAENILRNKILAEQVSSKPHFSEFYKIYKSERRKEKLRMAGSLAIELVALAAADIQRSYERQRQEEMIRRAVNDELKRHGM